MYYFASDMHLGLGRGESERAREAQLIRWLDMVSADATAIALVGDIFDFWFEWRRTVPKGFVRLLGKLAELTDRGVRIHFFTGNHDLWAFDYLKEECGVVVHQRPEVFEAYGKKIFVAHGDNLYLRGEKPLKIKFLNWLFYSRFWQAAFRTIVHPDLALKFGQWWSRHNRRSKGIAHEFKEEREHLIRYARAYARCVDVDYFVFGHLHVRKNYDLGDGRRAIVLGEWIEHPAYAVLSPEGAIELRRFE